MLQDESTTVVYSYVHVYDRSTPQFTGKERDSESGLDYFGARYYGSALGRFTSPDEPRIDQGPDDPQSWNLYNYGRNNPLRHLDLTGRKCVNTSSGPADDGTGGGCEAAGVSASGKITPQVFDVNDKGEMFTTISGVRNGIFPDGQTYPVGEPGIESETASIAVFVLPIGEGLLGRALAERLAVSLGGRILNAAGAKVVVELANGTLVTYTVFKSGTNLTVDISGVAFGNVGKLVPLRAILPFAREEGANTVTIVGSNVLNSDLARSLLDHGFESIGGNNFAKTFTVK